MLFARGGFTGSGEQARDPESEKGCFSPATLSRSEHGLGNAEMLLEFGLLNCPPPPEDLRAELRGVIRASQRPGDFPGILWKRGHFGLFRP